MHSWRLIPAKHECYVSQGTTETLFRWGGKRLDHGTENLTRLICTKLHQNRPRFVKDMTKKFGVFSRFTVGIAVHLQNANAKFHKVV